MAVSNRKMTNNESRDLEKQFEAEIHRLEQATAHVKELKEHDLHSAENNREDLKELMSQRFASYDRALDEARISLHEYKEQANEWRNQLKDNSDTFMPRVEALGRIDGIDKQVAELQKFQSQESGKELASVREKNREGRNIGMLVAIAIAIVSSAIAVISIVIKAVK